ncbi:hypothetical protein AAC387_Pa03g4247 [Persea americana]
MPSVFQWKRVMRKCNTIHHMKGLLTINSVIPEYQKSKCVPLCLRDTLKCNIFRGGLSMGVAKPDPKHKWLANIVTEDCCEEMFSRDDFILDGVNNGNTV